MSQKSMYAICTNAHNWKTFKGGSRLSGGVPALNETVRITGARVIDGTMYYEILGYGRATAKGVSKKGLLWDSQYFIPLKNKIKARDVFCQVFTDIESEAILN